MNQQLCIIESPSKCKKIQQFLGSSFKCIATGGHFRILKNIKSIKTKSNFEPLYEFDTDKIQYINKLKPTIELYHPSNVYLATDDDREGEAIAWHICQAFHLPMDTKRIIFHEITAGAIERAIREPTTVNMSIVFSQQCRQIFDMLVGFKISPFLWKHLNGGDTKTMSAGRCQTPALRLVYDNSRVEKVLDSKYNTFATFFDYKFKLNSSYATEGEALEFMEKSVLFDDYRMNIVKEKDAIYSPPRPFNTSLLLQTAANAFHFSSKHIMKLCQELYQKGFITYMRTENTQYSDEFIRDVHSYIEKKYGEKYVVKGTTKNETTEKGAIMREGTTTRNPHEAIRITDLNITSIMNNTGLDANIAPDLNKMYNLIRKNTIESCMTSAIYDVSNIEITAPDDKKYIHTIEIPKHPGWKRYSVDENETTDMRETTATLFYFQCLSPKTPIKPSKIESIVSLCGSHHYYTEASLIKKLEELGIGRPSTFSNIVEIIQDRKYVKKCDLKGGKIKCTEFEINFIDGNKITKKKVEKEEGDKKDKLVITPNGISTVEFLETYFSQLFSYNYTAKMEGLLDNSFNDADTIEELEKMREKICKECYQEIQGLAKSIKIERINIVLGEYLGETITIKKGKFGLYIEWGSKTESIKSIEKPLEDISLNDIIEFLELKMEEGNNERTIDGNKPRSRPKMPIQTNPNILRYINKDLSIRKNKEGNPYIFYKKETMEKPLFFPLMKFQKTFGDCDLKVLTQWINSTYIKKCSI
jgi:DNA topoisomerase-1